MSATRPGSSRAREAKIREWEGDGRPPCGACHTPIAEGEPIVVDHIRPYVFGHDYDPSNLRVIHKICNMLLQSGACGFAEVERAELPRLLESWPTWVRGESPGDRVELLVLATRTTSVVGRVVLARMRGRPRTVKGGARSSRYYRQRVDVAASFRAGKLTLTRRWWQRSAPPA